MRYLKRSCLWVHDSALDDLLVADALASYDAQQGAKAILGPREAIRSGVNESAAQLRPQYGWFVLMILERIPQRSQQDCAICAVAMALGYAYERVEADRAELAQFDDKTAWWEHYLWEAGCPNDYRPLADVGVVLAAGTPVIGLLVMQSRRLRAAHVVAIDEVGVLDPSDGFPEHMAWSMYPTVKRSQGFTLDSEFLAVSQRLPG